MLGVAEHEVGQPRGAEPREPDRGEVDPRGAAPWLARVISQFRAGLVPRPQGMAAIATRTRSTSAARIFQRRRVIIRPAVVVAMGLGMNSSSLRHRSA